MKDLKSLKRDWQMFARLLPYREVRRISKLIDTANAATDNGTWLRAAGELLGSLSELPQEKRVKLGEVYNLLRINLLAEIQTVSVAESVALTNAAESVAMPVDDWLDATIPSWPVPAGFDDQYRVAGEDQRLRDLRRRCVKKELGKNSASIRDLKSAMKKPIMKLGNDWIWSPGSMCHAYTEVALVVYGFTRHTKFVDVQVNNEHEQKRLYVEAVFGDKAGTQSGKIAHSFMRDGVGEAAVVIDVTYNQFFKHKAGVWPPVFHGTRANFLALN